MTNWQDVFSRDGLPWKDGATLSDTLALRDLDALKRFLDAVHIRFCLAKPYQEYSDYPIVESRELLPSFENDIFEYKNLPGFSMVAFARPMEYFSEIFQYDKLWPGKRPDETGEAQKLSPGPGPSRRNVGTIAARLPRASRTAFERRFVGREIASLENYPALLPYLLEMDRAQVMSWNDECFFHLSGVFASFPSDIDNEIKRFGLRIGKFANGDSELYERNRLFVYQYLMELYGFPIVSERRTSSALFARRLHRLGEHFLLRVLGQTDRTITTFTGNGGHQPYPKVEKIALARVDKDQKDALAAIDSGGYFLDRENRVVIIRVTYRQHRFDPNNARQDRALSVASQEILHPLTGAPLRGLNIIHDVSNLCLRLNDIVRGEYMGRIVYKRSEIVENTDNDEKRLKFLYTWLSKHQRRMIFFTDEYFGRVADVLRNYLASPKKAAVFASLRPLHQEVCEKLAYIHKARKVRNLEDISKRLVRGARISYRQMAGAALTLVEEVRGEIDGYAPDLVSGVLVCMDNILNDRYLARVYLQPPENELSEAGLEIRANCARLAALRDELRASVAIGNTEASVA